jgi:homoserine dehydrogenase
MMETIKVAVVGFGTIGSGVAKLLLTQGERIARHAGCRLQLQHVVDPDLTRPRNVQLPEGMLTDDLSRVADDPEIRVVAQLIGGIEPDRSIMLRLLESGKDVVTANKALLAEHGPDVFNRARDLGRSIAFEASVAGGIPIIAAIGQSLTANQVLSLQGILNGTSNFIVSKMEESGADYAEAVQEAQRLGYAEANPAMDVNGSDAAQKLAILAHLAFGAQVRWQNIPRIGIDRLDAADLRYAGELGYRIRLLASANLVDEGLELHVSPTLVRVGQPLAEVRGAFNAISVLGDAVGPVFFHGLGAGQMPTASAVVADMIDTVVGRSQITFRRLEMWSPRPARVSLRDYAQTASRYYLRFSVEDRPGVLAQISGILGHHQISIASVIQHEPTDGEQGSIVPLVIMTYAATEGAAQSAIEEIDHLTSVKPPSVRMRVWDDSNATGA